jgi:hypothetical protein
VQCIGANRECIRMPADAEAIGPSKMGECYYI